MKEKINIPKLAIMNDISGYGRCSLTVAIPVISACSVQACPVVTSVFSNHMGFSTYTKKDLTGFMENYLEHWEKISFVPDGILTGFLDSSEQLSIIKRYIQQVKIKNPICNIIIDPVMGDHGKTYRSVTPQFCEAMKEFIGNADLITPNITEACILAGVSLSESSAPSDDLIKKLIDTLHNAGPKQIVVTGISDETYFYNYLSDGSGSISCIKAPITGHSRPGTGDIFAGITSSLLLKDYTLHDAVSVAVRFLSEAIRITEANQIPVAEGVLLEAMLVTLINLISSVSE